MIHIPVSRFFTVLVVLLMILAIGGCSSGQDDAEDASFTVAATFYPLYDLTRSILGDTGTVYSIVPSGMEPHDYALRPSDIQNVHSADAFVTMGIEFAPLEEALVASVPSGVHIIAAGSGIDLLEASGNVDPHIWLSPKNAQLIAQHIMNGLIDANPTRAEYYTANGQELIADLERLDAEFTSGLNACEKDVILVNHNAFSYLARDYSFRTITISGLEPESEPTPQQLARLIDAAREHDVRYVFYEALVDPRVAQTIAREVGADVLELDPLEGTDDLSATYTSLMRQNLEQLRIALECQ